MWTDQSRGRMARIARKTKRYPSDLTDEEWEGLAPLMPRPGRRGRPREIDFREVINAVRYLVRSGCGWRMLPVHFGPWQTVYGWFRELARRFLFQTIHDMALMLDRERSGREASPSAGVIDSQSVKAPHAETRGYDAGKKITGRKRHIAVDTDGRLLMINLTPADISDSGVPAKKILWITMRCDLVYLDSKYAFQKQAWLFANEYHEIAYIISRQSCGSIQDCVSRATH